MTPAAAHMLSHAFKEWAVVCQALADGRQALIIRKGGIAEAGGAFTPEHRRFWLYPTYVHQQCDGIKSEADPLLEEAERRRLQHGTLRFTDFAEVSGVYHVRHLSAVLLLDGLHIWSEETIRKRFEYRAPGLYVLPVRIFRVREAFVLPEREEYEGCKTWVELEQALPTDSAVAVLDDRAYTNVLELVDRLLNPTALA
jgi:hypothetical protein